MKVLRFLVSTLIVVIGAALVHARTEMEPSRPTEAEILRLEDLRIAALIAQDFSALEALMAPDCVFVESDGSTRDTQGFIVNLKSGASVIESFVVDENRVQIIGEIAVVTGRYHNVVRKSGVRQPVKHARHTRVWRLQRDRRWRLIAHQATAMAALDVERK